MEEQEHAVAVNQTEKKEPKQSGRFRCALRRRTNKRSEAREEHKPRQKAESKGGAHLTKLRLGTEPTSEVTQQPSEEMIV